MSMTLGVEVYGLRGESHLLYAASYAHSMLSNRCNVLLCDVDGHIDSAIRDAPWLQRLGAGIEIVESLPASLDRVDRAYIGSPSIRRVFDRERPRPPARSVILDEGLGSYGSIRARYRALCREGSSTFSAFARATVRSATIAVTPKWRWRTYELTKQGWVINEAIARAFRAAAEPASTSDRIVLLTQPWVELGLVNETELLSKIGCIADAAEAAGLELLVCSHPWERVQRYDDFKTLRRLGPSELQAAVIGARLVVGETSTALLNLSAIFGVSSIRVSGLTAGVPLSATQRELLDHFVGQPVSIRSLVAEFRRLT